MDVNLLVTTNPVPINNPVQQQKHRQLKKKIPKSIANVSVHLLKMKMKKSYVDLMVTCTPARRKWNAMHPVCILVRSYYDLLTYSLFIILNSFVFFFRIFQMLRYKAKVLVRRDKCLLA